MTPEQLAVSPKTITDLHAWMGAMLASDLPEAAKVIAVRIALYLNLKTGRCDPAYTTLARESHVSERSVYRLVALLEHRGWIGVQHTRGRGNSNQYILKPVTAMAGFPAKKTCHSYGSISARKPAKSTTENLPNRPLKPVTAMAGELRNSEEEQRGETLSPDLDLKKGAGAKGKKKPKTAPLPEIEETFARFWSLYPRRDAEQRARREFAKAIEDTDPELIIAAAQRYALTEQARLTRPGQEPRHTAMACNWLRERRWTDPLPPGAVIDEQGNVVDIEQRQQQHGGIDLDAIEEFAKKAGLTW